jgi:hypothetical protein
MASKSSAGTANSNQRDNISIAFTDSQYPTPYTDQTIPGSTPGHRELRLGRQHQPPDITYNHLSHALVAHGDGQSCTAEPWEGNAHHPCPPGGNYVLHTKNGGKRHYDEASGMLSEQPWKPSKRLVFPLQEDERRVVPHRRGRGVYNTDDGFIHPDAEEAQRQREWTEERLREHGGKARVSGPPDHTLEDLGMVHQPRRQQRQQQQPLASEAAPVKRSGSSSPPDDANGGSGTSHTVCSNAAFAKVSAHAATLDEGRKENNAYNGQSLLPSTGAGVPLPRGMAAEAAAVALSHRDARMRCALYLRNKTLSATATRAADVQAVRELPNW